MIGYVPNFTFIVTLIDLFIVFCVIPQYNAGYCKAHLAIKFHRDFKRMFFCFKYIIVGEIVVENVVQSCRQTTGKKKTTVLIKCILYIS